MKHPVLNAQERTMLGKKVKQLRRQGLLPANVYGKSIKSKSLQVKVTDFQAVFKEAGETGLIDLTFDGTAHPVLIKNLQMNFHSKTPLHADFYQVNLKEKVKTMVPVTLIGEAKAVTEKLGMLLQTLSEVEIEALPDKLPDHLELNVESLAEVGQGLTVADIKVPEGVAILTDGEQQIVNVGALIVEEKVEEAPAPEEAAPAEEQAPAEGTAKTEEKPAETKPQGK